jgi:hypothetical protein
MLFRSKPAHVLIAGPQESVGQVMGQYGGLPGSPLGSAPLSRDIDMHQV